MKVDKPHLTHRFSRPAKWYWNLCLWDSCFHAIAQDWLNQAARHPGVTPEMLNVSIRGWGYLRDYCPKEWDAVLDFIYKAIQRLEDERAARQAAQEEQADDHGLG